MQNAVTMKALGDKQTNQTYNETENDEQPDKTAHTRCKSSVTRPHRRMEEDDAGGWRRRMRMNHIVKARAAWKRQS
jgi:hypothetical protein